MKQMDWGLGWKITEDWEVGEVVLIMNPEG